MANVRTAERVPEQKTARTQTTEERRKRGGSKFRDRDALLEAPEADDRPDIETDDEESWGGEETDQDGQDTETSDFQSPPAVRPLWALYGGRLLWASASIGRDVQERELLRRRIQAFLDFLAERFPNKTDEERLLAMRGLFIAEDNENSGEERKGRRENEGNGKNEKDSKPSTAWLNRLQKAGIIYGEEKILPLSALRAGQGQGQDTFPEPLARLWLERELEKRNEDSPLEWRNCKDWIVGIKNFYKEVEGQLNRFKEAMEGSGLGLKERNFPYNEGTLQRKHLPKWKKWWSARQGKAAE